MHITLQHFKSKTKLSYEFVDTPFFGNDTHGPEVFMAFRSRSAKRLFKKLDEKKAS